MPKKRELMPNTKSSWTMDTALTDAKIVVSPQDIMVSGASAPVTRNAVNDWSLNQVTTGATIIYGISVSKALERIGANMDLQEAFGTATPNNTTGGAQPAFTGNQGGPQSFTGRPPFTGQSYLAPVVGSIPKGIKLLDITWVYLIGTLALTSQTVTVNKVTYVNNVALATGAIAVTGALALATQANPYVTKQTVTTPLFNQTDNSDILIENTVVSPNTSAFRLYRVILHAQFNLN